MFTGSHAETGDEHKAAAARLSHVIGNHQTATGRDVRDQTARDVGSGAGRLFASMWDRAHARGFGMLWLTALTFSLLKQAEAAAPNVISLDDGNVTYKDLEHGSFELVTKEAIPRHFFVDDPGETIVLRPEGPSVTVTRVINSSARMAELQAAQQETLATLAKGLGSTGSSTPPTVDTPPAEPINFIQPKGGPTQNTLTPLPFISPALILDIPVAHPPPVPPTLHAAAGPTEIDTSAFDTFTATSGTFVASSANSDATLTYGVSGGTIGSTVVDGATYDVSKAGPYGTLYVNSTTGAYTFVPDSHAINALTEPTTTSFIITVSDGAQEADQTFSIGINGVNDAAIISGTATGSAVEASGVANRALGTPTATGLLTDTDVDNAPNSFTPASSASAGGYGTFTMTADGVWTYALDETNGAVQALNVGGTLLDSFTVTTVDGTARTVTIAIHGANDAAVISGTTTGAVTEAEDAKHGAPSVTGKLTDTDVDNISNSFTPISGTGGHGSYTMTAGGVWTYTLNEGDHAVQALNIGDTFKDAFEVTTVDGTRQLIQITIHGTNDAAIISGTTTGSVVEAGCHDGKPVACGQLTDTDVDNASNSFTPVISPIASAGGYGSFTMTADGRWTYTLDNANSAVQALNDCDTLCDSFVVTTIDGTEQVVEIIIQGANDAAIISGVTTGSVTEADDAKHGAPSVTGKLTDTDVDNVWNSFTPISGTGGHGSYTMTAGGVWTYTLDDCDPAVQALNFGGTLKDAFEVTTVDGTRQLVQITIHGTNDAAIISGTTTGSVIEAGCHDGKPVACGQLTDTDVDNAPDTFTPVISPTASAGGYGSFTMTADGRWAYTLDNANGAVQALNDCDTLCDSFIVTTIDGTEQVVKITIHGANDAAIISGTTTGSVVEAGCHDDGKPIACGLLTDTDVDNTPNSFTPVCEPETSAGGYGTFTMTADGAWTYTLDNDNCAVQALNDCDTLTDCFKVTTIDGTAQEVTITIQGATDGDNFKWLVEPEQQMPRHVDASFVDTAMFSSDGAFRFTDGISGGSDVTDLAVADHLVPEPVHTVAFQMPHDLLV